ncbi:TLC domain-containing protein [Plasmodiophora brassicae]|uniref:Uncharacterized protein n=1 Tax=Plasmodiophora brassicae TaxID=37360 RepID=A0A3P3Y0P4_PLABS|nr:unnamed protein product [Plasmodiophora brassicae]
MASDSASAHDGVEDITSGPGPVEVGGTTVRPVKVNNCLVRFMRYPDVKAVNLVTSYYLSDRALFRWRLSVLLYISWATGMQMYQFFQTSAEKEWNITSPVDYYMYLTNWCFSFVWLHFLLSMLASGYRLAANLAGNPLSDWADSATIVESYHGTVTYTIYIISLFLSQFVTIAFWMDAIRKSIREEPSELGRVHALFICVNVHGLQSLVILVEYVLLNKIRLEWSHAFLAFVPILCYMPVNMFYTLVRGTAPYDQSFWKEARRTWDSVGGTLLVLTIVYLAFMLVGSVRRRFNEPDTDKLDDDGTTDTPGGETAPDNAV